MQHNRGFAAAPARRILAAAILAAAATLPEDAAAQLAGAEIVAGHAAIKTLSPTRTVIVEFSKTAIIDWSSFSIPAGSSVTIVQKSASAILLDRVLGGAPSLIAGSLSADGAVWLVNPAGVTIAPTGTISAASVLVSTADITNGDFRRGTYDFDLPGAAGAQIVNEGSISAPSGTVLLAAPSVRNDGLIEAQLGTVALAGAETFAVDFAGDTLLSFAITGPVVESGGALVTNAGTLAAPGGKVLLTAAAAKSILDNVINTSGIIEATSVANVDGKIVLSASNGGTDVAGTLDASGKGTGESGGTIEVFGDSVTLEAGARLDVSGDSGGGTALVGGDFHGAGPDPSAAATTVAQGALIDADALTFGTGGNVAVWSSGTTLFDGTITARGGSEGGNGGMVETSGQALSIATGFVDTRAPNGAAGDWLMDPASIVVESGGVGSLAGNQCTFAENTCATIDPSAIENAASNVTLQATQNITFDDAIAMANNGVGLTAEAGNSITLASGASITTNGGAIALFANSNAGGTASGSGSVILGAALNTTGNAQLGGAITLSVSGGTGSITLDAVFTSASGAITLDGPTVLAPGLGYNFIGIDTTNNATTAGANIAFNGPITDATPPTSFQVTAGIGSVTFGGPIGSVAAPLSGATVSGSAISLGGSIDASGGFIVLTGAITLATSLTIDNTIDAPDGNFVNLIGTVDGTTPGAQSLTVNSGAATLGAAVGSRVPLGALIMNGSFFNLDAAATTITTAGGAVSFSAQIFSQSGLVIDTTAAGHPAGASVDFASSLNTSGPSPLTVEAGTGGTVTFNGGNTPFGAVSLTGANIMLGNGGFNTAGGAVTLTGTTVLAPSLAYDFIGIDTTNGGGSPGANVVFNGPIVDATPLATFQVTAGTGSVTFDSAVGSTASPLSGATVSGSAISLGGNIDASGGFVVLTGPITLATSLTIDNTIGAPAGNFVNLLGTINGTTPGAQSLTVNSGAASLGDVVGARVPLGALTLNGSFFILDEAATSITTAGGPVSFSAQVDSTSGLTIDTTAAGHPAGASVDFASSLNTSGPTPLTVDAGTGGTVTFNGGNSPFGTVNLTGAAIALSAVGTAGAPVTLNGPTILTGSSYVAIDTTNFGGSSGANIQFNGTVGGAPSLDLTSGSGTIALGIATPSGGLGVSGSGITLGGNITTASGVVNIMAPATLTTNVTIDTTAGGRSPGAPIILGQIATNGFILTLIDQANLYNADEAALATLQTLDSGPALTVSSAGETPGSAASPTAPLTVQTGGPQSDTVGNVSDLNAGSTLFSQIQPASQNAARDPVTAVSLVGPASQAIASVFSDDTLDGPDSFLHRSRRGARATILVPGIDRAASSSGNRALWYSELQRELAFSVPGLPP